jgi:hypothetical protein
MTGDLEQCICLCSYGNAILAQPSQEPMLIDAVPSTAFANVGVVRLRQRTVAGHAAFREWVTMLKTMGSRRLWLGTTAGAQYLSPHLSEAFANANPRAITAETPNGYLGWTTTWDFQKSKDWAVTFSEIETLRPPVAWGLESCFSTLQRSIYEIREFSLLASEKHWTQLFENALNALDSNVRDSRLPDIGYTNQAHSIMSAAASAWVFGGMGSWNDLWFDDQKLLTRYNTVTENLYNAVIGSVMSSVNSFHPGAIRT